MPSASPRATENDTPSSARTDTIFGTGQPRLALKVLARSLTSSRGRGRLAHGALTQQRTRCSGSAGSGLSGGRSAHCSMRKGQRDW